MYKISAAQSKAARAFLEWSQDELSRKANVASSTLRNFENGIAPRLETMKKICRTLENAGIEFIEGGGVRPRSNFVRMYMGHDSCDQFFDDMMQTIQEQGGDIVCFAKSQEMLVQSCGILPCNSFERLERLREKAALKCIVPETVSSFDIPAVQFRTLAQEDLSPWDYYVFGDKYAHILQEGRSNFIFVVYHKPFAAEDYHRHFQSKWDKAAPLRQKHNLRFVV